MITFATGFFLGLLAGVVLVAFWAIGKIARLTRTLGQKIF
jgi:hypothetical protein